MAVWPSARWAPCGSPIFFSKYLAFVWSESLLWRRWPAMSFDGVSTCRQEGTRSFGSLQNQCSSAGRSTRCSGISFASARQLACTGPRLVFQIRWSLSVVCARRKVFWLSYVRHTSLRKVSWICFIVIPFVVLVGAPFTARGSLLFRKRSRP